MPQCEVSIYAQGSRFLELTSGGISMPAKREVFSWGCAREAFSLALVHGNLFTALPPYLPNTSSLKPVWSHKNWRLCPESCKVSPLAQ